jgi:hypothetical protein
MFARESIHSCASISELPLRRDEMNTIVRVVIVCLISIFTTVTVFAQSAGGEADALVKIKVKRVDKAFLLPGADFSTYKKVIIAPSEVSFQKNWLRDINNQRMSPSRQIKDSDVKKIIEIARSGFDEIWAEGFKAAGYEVVTTPGEGVLKLVPSVFDLFVNAPDVLEPGRTYNYTVEAGEAALSLDVRDSVSGTLLGRIIDKRIAGNGTNSLQWTTSVSNRSDFGHLFKTWAKIAADGLGQLAKASPLPETLKPNQKLPKKQP